MRTPGQTRFRVPTLCVCLLAATAGAQDYYSIDELIRDGDAVPGVGLVTAINGMAVNDLGEWILEVDTDNPDTDADVALLKNGALFLVEGQALPAPLGATLGSFDALSLNDAGDSGWNFFLDNTTGLSDDSGLYFNTSLLIQEGEDSTAPGFSPSTPYIGFFEARLNDSQEMIVLASVDDAAIPTSVDRAFVKLDLDGSGGLLSETLLYKEGDLLPGQVDPVSDFETGPHNFAFNDAGQLLYAAELDGPAASDHALYLDDLLIAQEGGVSPVPGIPWEFLFSPELDLDDAGNLVYSGILDTDASTDSTIVSRIDGVQDVVAREGSGLPGTGGFVITSFGTAPIHLGNNGRVLFFADWDDPNTDEDTGLFLDQVLIVQEGVTTVGGTPIDSFAGVTDGFAMSPSGRYLLFEAKLNGNVDGAFLIDTGPWTDLGSALAGVTGEPELLGTGPLTAASANALDLLNAAPGALAALFVALDSNPVPFKGGTVVPFPILTLPFFFTNGAGAFTLPFTWPTGLPVGLEVYFQAGIDDAAAIAGVSLSNAVRGTTE